MLSEAWIHPFRKLILTAVKWDFSTLFLRLFRTFWLRRQLWIPIYKWSFCGCVGVFVSSVNIGETNLGLFLSYYRQFVTVCITSIQSVYCINMLWLSSTKVKHTAKQKKLASLQILCNFPSIRLLCLFIYRCILRNIITSITHDASVRAVNWRMVLCCKQICCWTGNSVARSRMRTYTNAESMSPPPVIT